MHPFFWNYLFNYFNWNYYYKPWLRLKTLDFHSCEFESCHELQFGSNNIIFLKLTIILLCFVKLTNCQSLNKWIGDYSLGKMNEREISLISYHATWCDMRCPSLSVSYSDPPGSKFRTTESTLLPWTKTQLGSYFASKNWRISIPL